MKFGMRSGPRTGTDASDFGTARGGDFGAARGGLRVLLTRLFTGAARAREAAGRVGRDTGEPGAERSGERRWMAIDSFGLANALTLGTCPWATELTGQSLDELHRSSGRL